MTTVTGKEDVVISRQENWNSEKLLGLLKIPQFGICVTGIQTQDF